jgi:D-glycero-D-manno-heptose 1,7-bisphosphate phosphatase
MILEAARTMGIDLASSYTVGDSDSDVAAGKQAGTRPVRIGTLDDVNADMAFPSLLDFALFLKEQASNRADS